MLRLALEVLKLDVVWCRRIDCVWRRRSLHNTLLVLLLLLCYILNTKHINILNYYCLYKLLWIFVRSCSHNTHLGWLSSGIVISFSKVGKSAKCVVWIEHKTYFAIIIVITIHCPHGHLHPSTVGAGDGGGIGAAVGSGPVYGGAPWTQMGRVLFFLYSHCGDR